MFHAPQKKKKKKKAKGNAMHKHSTPVCRKCKIKGGGKKIDVSLVKEVPLHNHKRKTMRKKKKKNTSRRAKSRQDRKRSGRKKHCARNVFDFHQGAPYVASNLLEPSFALSEPCSGDEGSFFSHDVAMT